MAGVYGLVDPGLDKASCATTLERMMAPSFDLRHHVRDLACGCGWGLAVVSGRQPSLQRRSVSSADGRFTFVLDGELHGSHALEDACLSSQPLPARSRDDPSSRLLAALEDHGLEALRDFNGVFLLALWDSVKRELWAAGDCSGLRSLYYAHAGERIAFASEQTGLLAVPWVSREPDLTAIRCFAQHGIVLGENTLLRAVRALAGGTYLRFRDGQLLKRRYWRLPIGQPQRMSSDEAGEEFAALWRTVIRDQTRDPLRYGCLLSGGLDSRMILAGLVEAGLPCAAFTFGNQGCADVRIARQLARSVNMRHHHQPVAHADIVDGLDSVVSRTGGVFNCFDGSVRFLNPLLAHSIDVVTDGWMLLDGTHYTPQAFMRNHVCKWDAIRWLHTILRRNSDVASYRLSNGEHASLVARTGPLCSVSFDVNAHLSDFLACAGDAARDPLWVAHLFRHEVRQHRLMAHGPSLSWQVSHVRCPGADKRVLEFVARLPKRYRSREKPLQITTIRRLAPELARVPWGMSRLPISWPGPLLYGGLLGSRVLAKVYQVAAARVAPRLRATDVAVDYGQCLRAEPSMQRLVRTLLVDRGAASSGFFDRGAVSQLLADHVTGGANHAETIGRLLTIEMWFAQTSAGVDANA